MIKQPRIPIRFLSRLKRLCRELDVEWLGNHWAIIDKKNLISVFRREGGGICRFKKLYDRVLHLQPSQRLGGSVINKLQYMSMARWGKKADLVKHLNDQMDRGEAEKLERKIDFHEDMINEVKTLNRFSINLDGRRDDGDTPD